MVRHLQLAFLGFLLSVLAGCAAKPQLPVPLAPIAAGDAHRVGVALAAVPKASLELPGANCLLCIIAAQAANAPVAKHIESLDPNEFKPVRDRIAAALRKQGATVKVIDDPIEVEALAEFNSTQENVARRDYKPLKKQYGVDKLLLLTVEAHGLERSYAAYIPAGDPRVFLRATGALIHLDTNTYEWYLPTKVLKGADGGRWDEPPKYPGLTNAYFQVLEEGKDRLLEPWGR